MTLYIISLILLLIGTFGYVRFEYTSFEGIAILSNIVNTFFVLVVSIAWLVNSVNYYSIQEERDSLQQTVLYMKSSGF